MQFAKERIDIMGGLEQITAHILDNAKKEAEKIIEEAHKKAEEINQKAKARQEEKSAKAEEEIKEEIQRIIEISDAKDKQEKRQILLDKKSRIIEDTIKRAKEKMLNSKEEDYRKIIKTLLKKSISEQNGEIIFSKREQGKISKEFILECEKLSNGKLTVSDKTCDIENGFIIRYEKIDINCSIDAIFIDLHNELTDLVNSYITAD